MPHALDGASSLDRIALTAARTLSKIGLLVLICFAVATLIDGLTRTVANQPIDLVRDVGELVVAVSVSCCFPQAFLERRNIVIAVTDMFLSRAANRALDLIAALVTLVVLLLFALQFFGHARELAAAGETTFMLRLPKAPFWYVVDANLWLASLAQAVAVTRQVRGLLRPVEARRASAGT